MRIVFFVLRHERSSCVQSLLDQKGAKFFCTDLKVRIHFVNHRLHTFLVRYADTHTSRGGAFRAILWNGYKTFPNRIAGGLVGVILKLDGIIFGFARNTARVGVRSVRKVLRPRHRSLAKGTVSIKYDLQWTIVRVRILGFRVPHKTQRCNKQEQ